MPNAAKTIKLPGDLQAFAEERVRGGENAMEEKKLAVLREALDVGIAELDAGLGVETSPEELMAEIYADVGLER